MAALLSLQAGCASMTEGECLTGDWSRIGYHDGAAGYPPSRLSEHAQACAAYGVHPDADAYLIARERGLSVYCTPYRGFEAGRQGREYQGVCPPRLAGGFLAGYEDGRRVYAAVEHRDAMRSEARQFNGRIEDIEEELDRIRAQLADEYLTPEARETLRDRRRDLRGELHRAHKKWERAKRREHAAADHANRLYQALSHRYGAW